MAAPETSGKAETQGTGWGGWKSLMGARSSRTVPREPCAGLADVVISQRVACCRPGGPGQLWAVSGSKWLGQDAYGKVRPSGAATCLTEELEEQSFPQAQGPPASGRNWGLTPPPVVRPMGPANRGCFMASDGRLPIWLNSSGHRCSTSSRELALAAPLSHSVLGGCTPHPPGLFFLLFPTSPESLPRAGPTQVPSSSVTPLSSPLGRRSPERFCYQ